MVAGGAVVVSRWRFFAAVFSSTFLAATLVCATRQQDFFYYENEFPVRETDLQLNFRLLPSLNDGDVHGVPHRIERRHAPPDSDTKIWDNRSNPSQTSDSNVTEAPPAKISKNKMQKGTPSPPQPPTEVNQKPPNTPPLTAKNLGVNGTGIRKNVTTVSPKAPEKVPEKATSSVTNVADAAPDPENATTPEIDSEFSISNFTDSTLDLDKVLKKHNINKTQQDHHLYYNSSNDRDPATARRYWVDMEDRSDVKINELLSRSHRRAATVKLSFDFPFYGHLIRNITIATGGFLYTGDYVHSWLAMTQYIAPLMANFDTSLSNDSYIKYVDNGTAFTVQWDNVSLQDKPNEGRFTFQASLLSNGDIIFVYKNIPVIIENIQDDHHPVKVGLSDAYLIESTIFFIRRKTIYEYHRVNFRKEDIGNWTTIYLKALPTCLDNKNCTSCLEQESTPAFTCLWCPDVNRCSNGVDRHRQEWLTNDCHVPSNFVTNETQCSHSNGSSSSEAYDERHFKYSHEVHRGKSERIIDHSQVSSRIYQDNASREGVGGDAPVNMGVSGVIAILFIVAMISGLGVWIFYAYRNPHTTSGQMLIRYRPSQWRWRRGEARYTAATIHM